MQDLSMKVPAGNLPPVGDYVPGSSPKGSSKIKWFKRAGILALFVLFTVFGYFGYKVYATWSAIGTRNAGNGAPALAGVIDPNQLKGEGDGRVNILLIGRDQVAGLTDTVILASIDPETGHTAMLSLPRDLYVQIHGTQRLEKINAVYGYGEKTRYAGGGPQLLKDTVADIIDVPIHYYASVNFGAFKKIIDTVGGVEVHVEKSIYDPTFPKDDYRGVQPFSIKAGTHLLDGETALKYVRTRKGVNSGNDFGRAARQQQVIEAVAGKVKDQETFLNPKRINEILNTLGKNARTDLQLWEIQKLTEIGKKTESGKVTSVVLTNERGKEGSFLVSGRSGGGAYILKPKSGTYAEIQEFVHSIFVDPYLKKDAAKIELKNGTRRLGLAAQVGKLLTNYNYNVVKTSDADRSDYENNEIIVVGSAKERIPYTLRLLSLRFKVAEDKIKYVEETPESGAEVIVILGANYVQK